MTHATFGLLPPLAADDQRLAGANPLVPPAFVWRFPGWIIRWKDGDTGVARISRGFDDESVKTFRLLGSTKGVQAPEIHAADPVMREKAQAALTRVLALAPVGASVILAAETKTGELKPDGFGRVLSQLLTADGTNVGDVLLAEGLAIPYAKG